jgi:hypothetical protein
MIIAWSGIPYTHEASREQARARQVRSSHFLHPRLSVRSEIYLYTEGLPGVSKPEYLEQLMGLQPLTTWRAENGMIDSEFLGLKQGRGASQRSM